MKNVFFKSMFATVVAAMAFTACSSDVEDVKTPSGELKHVTLTAKTQSTRTALSGDGVTVLWNVNDKFSVFEGDCNHKFGVENINGESADVADLGGDMHENEMYCAMYPYKSGVTAEMDYVTSKFKGVTIPSTQKAYDGTFDPAASIMLARSHGGQIDFVHACAYLKVTTGSDCDDIEISVGSIDRWDSANRIAGTFNINLAGGEITRDLDDSPSYEDNAKRKVTVLPASGTSIDAGTYYIAVAPEKITSLKIDFVKNSTVKATKTANIPAGSSIELQAGEVLYLGEFMNN